MHLHDLVEPIDQRIGRDRWIKTALGEVLLQSRGDRRIQRQQVRQLLAPMLWPGRKTVKQSRLHLSPGQLLNQQSSSPWPSSQPSTLQSQRTEKGQPKMARWAQENSHYWIAEIVTTSKTTFHLGMSQEE